MDEELEMRKKLDHLKKVTGNPDWEDIATGGGCEGFAVWFYDESGEEWHAFICDAESGIESPMKEKTWYCDKFSDNAPEGQDQNQDYMTFYEAAECAKNILKNYPFELNRLCKLRARIDEVMDDYTVLLKTNII